MNENNTKLYEISRKGGRIQLEDLFNSCDFTQTEIDVAFSLACINGNYAAVKYLLENNKYRPNLCSDFSKDITSCLHGFFKACQNDYVNIVKLILDNPDLKNRPNLDESGLIALRCAASGGSVDVFRYMLELPQIKKQLNVINNEVSVFYSALVNMQEEVLKYMIFDLSLNKTSEVNEMVKDMWDKNFSSFVDSLFFIRETKEKLQSEIGNNANKKYKLKCHWDKKI